VPHAKAAAAIYYDDRGQGEPALLFIPGWCATREAYGRLPELCAAHRRTLALDWRGHGNSGPASDDFGSERLVEDALAVIASSKAEQVVPVALVHSGWIAIELRQRLAHRIPKIVLCNWIVTDPPPAFMAVVKGLQDPNQWQQMRDRLFSLWLEGVDNPEATHFRSRHHGIGQRGNVAAVGPRNREGLRESGKSSADDGGAVARTSGAASLPANLRCRLGPCKKSSLPRTRGFIRTAGMPTATSLPLRFRRRWPG